MVARALVPEPLDKVAPHLGPPFLVRRGKHVARLARRDRAVPRRLRAPEPPQRREDRVGLRAAVDPVEVGRLRGGRKVIAAKQPVAQVLGEPPLVARAAEGGRRLIHVDPRAHRRRAQPGGTLDVHATVEAPGAWLAVAEAEAASAAAGASVGAWRSSSRTILPRGVGRRVGVTPEVGALRLGPTGAHVGSGRRRPAKGRRGALTRGAAARLCGGQYHRGRQGGAALPPTADTVEPA